MAEVQGLTARGAATRARMLEAAAEEFAQRGIAGARVDRIVDAARSNKAQLYAYFGSKEGLFDAVFAEHVDRIVDAVPIDGHDLPGYAVRLYDSYLEHPEVVRLATWNRLERHPVGDLFDDGLDHDEHKTAHIRSAQQEGAVDPALDAHDVLAMVTAISMTWSPASAVLTATSAEPQEVHDRRREAIRAAVLRLIGQPRG